MAPKSKTKAKAQPKAQPKAKSQTLKSGSQAHLKKARNDRDKEIKGTRTLKKFVGWNHDQKFKHRVNGKTLWETILDDYEGGAKRLPPSRILCLKVTFSTAGTGFKAVPKVATEAKSQRLLHCLAISMIKDSGVRDRDPLYSYMALTSKMSEGDLCAILNSLNQCDMHTGNADFLHVLEVLKLVCARGWHRDFPEVFQATKEFFIAAKLRDLNSSLGKISSKEWYQNNKDTLDWALDCSEVDKLYEEGPEALNQAAKCALMKKMVAEGSKLAEAMFQNDIAKQSVTVFTQKVDDLIRLLKRTPDMQTLRSTQAACFLLAEEYADELDNCEEWDCVMEYGGRPIKLVVSDPFIHIDHQIDAVKKCCTIGKKGGPPKMLPEIWLDGESADGEVEIPFDAKELASAVKGRNYFNETLTKSCKDKAYDILVWSGLRQKQWEERDRLFAFESAVLDDLANNRSGAVLKQQCLSCLATSEKTVTIKEAVSNLENMKTTKLFAFCPTDISGPIMSSFDIVQQMHKGKLETHEFQALTGFDRIVADGLKWFCVHKSMKPGSLEQIEKKGTAALEAKMKAVRDKPDDPATPDIVADVLCYKFLLEPADKDEFDTLAKKHFAIAAGLKQESVPKNKKPKKNGAGEEKSQMELALEAANNLW